MKWGGGGSCQVAQPPQDSGVLAALLPVQRWTRSRSFIAQPRLALVPAHMNFTAESFALFA